MFFFSWNAFKVNLNILHVIKIERSRIVQNKGTTFFFLILDTSLTHKKATNIYTLQSSTLNSFNGTCSGSKPLRFQSKLSRSTNIFSLTPHRHQTPIHPPRATRTLYRCPPSNPSAPHALVLLRIFCSLPRSSSFHPRFTIARGCGGTVPPRVKRSTPQSGYEGKRLGSTSRRRTRACERGGRAGCVLWTEGWACCRRCR